MTYKKHFSSYELNTTDNNENHVLKNIKDFNSPLIHTYKLPSNETAVRLKNYF